ncbi:MAG: LysM peptidoglycan-binding domain-containing M23 family metallopeptidase [Herpetosiphonaceae bacterium]|nr:LysM peptidoglycan-binding domain-containing M23 family metallopeptidase [Herpetosiphonaceae bacterium]
MFVVQYVLQPHDTLRRLATRYGLHVESLIGSNRLGEYLAIGDSIRIPRVDGVVHTVVVDETLNHIAQLYLVDWAMILTYPANNLDRGQALQEGQEIFIPYAQLPADRRPQVDLADAAAVPLVVVQTDAARLWSGPGDVYKRVGTVQQGEQLRVIARHDAWLQVQGAAGDVWIEQKQILAPAGVIDSVAEVTVLPPGPPTWVWPTIGSVSSPFGWRDFSVGTFHNGIDIANSEGTPIYAIRRGTVTEAGWCSGFGYCVKMRHEGGFTSTYGHMMAQPNVAVGAWVEAGELIGLMGTTYDLAGGGFSTGPHLHLTLKLDVQAVDPLRWLSPGK